MAPAILQSLIVPLCSPRGCCVVLAVSECNTAKCSFSAVCPPWEAFDQLRCCVCFKVSLLACSAPWSSGVLRELKPGFLQIVFSRIRRRVHDKLQLFSSSAESLRATTLLPPCVAAPGNAPLSIIRRWWWKGRNRRPRSRTRSRPGKAQGANRASSTRSASSKSRCGPCGAVVKQIVFAASHCVQMPANQDCGTGAKNRLDGGAGAWNLGSGSSELYK